MDTGTATLVEDVEQVTHGGDLDDADAELVEELLVEEISIDGMCGVY